MTCKHTRRPDRSSMFPAHFRDDNLLLWASSACETKYIHNNPTVQDNNFWHLFNCPRF